MTYPDKPASSRWEQAERKGWSVAAIAFLLVAVGGNALWVWGYGRDPNSFEMLGTVFLAILIAIGVKGWMTDRPPKPE